MSEFETRYEFTTVFPEDMSLQECLEAVRCFMLQNNYVLRKTEREGHETHTTYELEQLT